MHEHEPRPRRAAPHGWAAWAWRLLLAFSFAVGMVGGRSRPLVESPLEPTVEIGEDGEAFAREENEARIVRRQASQPRGTWAQAIDRSRPPQALAPTITAPPPPRWQRPRRAPPPADDDGTAIG